MYNKFTKTRKVVDNVEYNGHKEPVTINYKNEEYNGYVFDLIMGERNFHTYTFRWVDDYEVVLYEESYTNIRKIPFELMDMEVYGYKKTKNRLIILV